jgi:hypothetical protein
MSIVILVGILILIAAYSAEAVSALTSINPVGAVMAAFAAVVGFTWLLKTAKKV